MSHVVLLVDDDTQVLAGLRRALHREPYEILTAGTALDALAALESRPVDLVVSDYEMAGMSGVELLSEVRARFPAAVRIMLTGRASLEVAVKAINRGEVFRFLAKPAAPEELALAIRQGLQQHDLVAESRRLLGTVRRQHAALAELETEVRGITRVERDSTGAIVVDEAPSDLDQLIREMQAASSSPGPSPPPSDPSARSPGSQSRSS